MLILNRHVGHYVYNNEMAKGRSVEEKLLILDRVAGSASKLAACQREGIGTSTYYRWLKEFRKYNVEGLKNKNKKPFRSPNATCQSTVNVILRLANTGSYRFASEIQRELNARGVRISVNTVIKILKQKNMYTRTLVNNKGQKPYISRVILG